MTDRVLVFTYKEGLLSRLAHDLQIECHRFEIERHGTEVTGRFALGSLRVDGAVQHGRVAPGVLSDGDRRKIEQTMADDVLESRRFAEATLRATLVPATRTLEGSLTLHGRTASLPPVVVQRRGAQWVAEVTLQPSRWGIAPYRALAGALKLQDRVMVRVELGVQGDGEIAADGDAAWRSGATP